MTKTVLITGASRGIGRETALQFAGAGWRVAIHYHKSEADALSLLQQLNQMGCDAQVFCADVAVRSEVETMVAAVTKRFGGIHLLINNAGIAQQKLFSDITCDDWSRMFDVNINGIFHLCQCVLPQMISRKEGKIINLSSIWGMTGASCEVHYAASKAAVIGFTKALAKEVAPSGIQVNCVAPGVIATDMLGNLDAQTLDALREETPLGRLGTPRDITGVLLFLAGEQADFITGQVISPNGGFLI